MSINTKDLVTMDLSTYFLMVPMASKEARAWIEILVIGNNERIYFS